MMRQAGFVGVAALLLVLAGLQAGCEWSGGSSNSFNTSRGAGVNLNITGFYEGQGTAGRAVDTSRGNIRNFTITQNGNRLDVIDNQGSRYRGSVGSPDVSGAATRGASIPARTQIMQFQVNWRGTDGVAGQDIQFVGVIDVVSLTTIRATETIIVQDRTTTDSVIQESEGSRSRQSGSEQQTEEDTGSGGTIIEDIGGATNIAGQVAFMAGVIVTNIQTTVTQGESSSASQERTRTSDAVVDRGTITQTSFALTPANTRFRLRGTWVEASGRASTVNAISTGSGTISITPEGERTVATGRTGTLE